MSITTTTIFRRWTMPLAVLLTAIFAVRGASAQAGKPASPDAAKVEQLMNELATLQAEMAKLKKRVVELEKENAELKASGATLPAKGTGTPGTPGTSGTPGKGKPAADENKFAAVPSDPLAAPEAALATYTADYAAKVKSTSIDTPADRQKTLGEVGGWARTAKKFRGKADWTIEIKEITPDALKGGGSIRFSVVDPVSKRPYSDLVVTQPVNQAQLRALNDKPDQKTWKLVGTFSADPKVNKDLEKAESSPMFIGVFAEMNTTLTVQTLTPSG
jgi:hypothetical protein